MTNIKQFSSAHMKSAYQILTKQINYDWCNSQWTDNEINMCKALELKSFISKPSLSTYPIKNEILNGDTIVKLNYIKSIELELSRN